MPFLICYITDRRGLEPKPLLPRLLEAIGAGVDLVQIRENDLETRALAELVTAAVAGARRTTTRIAVNDRLDVAWALGAHGVHLGNHSLPAEVVRRLAPRDFLLGVSCHSLDEALAAETARADYIVLGPVFATPSKIRYGPPLGLEKLREVTARVKIPVLALGGITVEGVKRCLEAGAAGVAGIRLFQDCESVEKRARELRAAAGP